MNMRFPAAETEGLGRARSLEFWQALRRRPSREWVRNLDVTLDTVTIGDDDVPISISEPSRGNSYVCSPLASYVDYARDELHMLTPGLARAAAPLLGALGRALEAGQVDRVVFVNNWLLSTNLYPRSSPPAVTEGWLNSLGPAHRELVLRFPRHAIGFRSLNERSNPGLLTRLEALGYRRVPARRVYWFDGTGDGVSRRSNTRADLALLARGDYRVIPWPRAAPLERAEELYRQLYVEKYPPLNPQFTTGFLREAVRRGVVRLYALERVTGEIDGVLGLVERDGVLTAPIVGYDTRLPMRLGLYRRLMAAVLKETLERGLALNLSAGAGHFKRLRGGSPLLEWTAFYTSHLPARSRWAWAALSNLAEHLGRPILEAVA